MLTHIPLIGGAESITDNGLRGELVAWLLSPLDRPCHWLDLPPVPSPAAAAAPRCPAACLGSSNSQQAAATMETPTNQASKIGDDSDDYSKCRLLAALSQFNHIHQSGNGMPKSFLRSLSVNALGQQDSMLVVRNRRKNMKNTVLDYVIGYVIKQ